VAEPAWHLAELNIARLRAPIDDPMIAEFADALATINELADTSDGFVWRYQTDEGNATATRPYEDPLVIINLSVWTSMEALHAYVYRSDHTPFLRRRREWFEPMDRAAHAMWWMPAGQLPTVEQAVARLEHLRSSGPSEYAFTLRQQWPAPTEGERDERAV